MLLCADVMTSCQHEWLCSCKWCKAIKHHGNSPLVIQIDDKNWMGEESSHVVAKKFYSSSVALIPSHGCMHREIVIVKRLWKGFCGFITHIMKMWS